MRKDPNETKEETIPFYHPTNQKTGGEQGQGVCEEYLRSVKESWYLVRR
jgi:hypothetical protein